MNHRNTIPHTPDSFNSGAMIAQYLVSSLTATVSDQHFFPVMGM
ncbi:hypothetical protein [Candidatus Nitrospira neomarina]|uniref:Uncharacterized protein n=1 Tax=Candidatus Nitrospira neomarina TaxID=3020899 RepID=A0AA96JWY6_9BACT|nr:hypothetical protein [Candidatus Nitrospira neomarina]WNM62535.1 hypothetical protein PQG83_01965 [Candidatus Nitrospira neomarina]